MKGLTQLMILFVWISTPAQNFIRSQLSTPLDTPWEIVYGPDGFLWLTEAGGKVVRVNPADGSKTVVYTAPDYFGGGTSETSPLCFQPKIGSGTFGLALHPDFTNSATAFIYFVYSYNSGTSISPVTKFKIERLTWNAATNSVTANSTMVFSMPTGYDHLGGRLMIIKQNFVPYIFFTVGDNGVSETNEPACYSPQSNNPNNFAQDPNYKNGKVHRFNMDGTIPATNPLPGNSFYTRGHRNPQGLMFNSSQSIIYDIEHGDRTDDEINILEVGMNYGWKNVRGFHNDNNYPGEAAYVSSYTPYPGIANDALKEPLFAWCSTPQPTISTFLDWCTVAPSDGIYYGGSGIPDWTNSLLVVTLKDGSTTDQELYQFKLNQNGTSLVPSTASDPNPKKFFGSDQAVNGRLRDITVSPDGTKIYLINNGGNTPDKITVYTYNSPTGLNRTTSSEFDLKIYPNPSNGVVTIDCAEGVTHITLFNPMGEQLPNVAFTSNILDVTNLPEGAYFLKIQTLSGKVVFKKMVRTL